MTLVGVVVSTDHVVVCCQQRALVTSPDRLECVSCDITISFLSIVMPPPLGRGH